MEFTPKYMENALYYQPWKTKFIERFCVPYAKMLSYVRNDYDKNKKFIADTYAQLFLVVMNVLRRILKSNYDVKCVFFPDIIFNAYQKKIIDDIELYYRVLKFLYKYKQDENYLNEFSRDYLKIYYSFSKNFKYLTKTGGNRDKNYIFYDNSEFLWGLKQTYYNKIINFFLSYPKLKIVRIFGSRVTSEYKEFSDLDLIFEGTYSLTEYYDILDDFLNLDIPYVIDVYDLGEDNRAFLYRNTVRANIFYERKIYVEDYYTSVLS